MAFRKLTKLKEQGASEQVINDFIEDNKSSFNMFREFVMACQKNNSLNPNKIDINDSKFGEIIYPDLSFDMPKKL